MNTTPVVLTSLPGSAWHGSPTHFRLKSEITSATGAVTGAVYGAYGSAGWVSATDDYSIKVTFATDVWSDNGSSNPVVFDSNGIAVAGGALAVNGANVELREANGTLQYHFVKPTAATGRSWTPTSGGGTATEGVSVPYGDITHVGQDIRVIIDKNSPSSSSTVSYSIQKNGVSQGSGISHTNNSTTDFVQNLPFATGIWKLWYQESGGGGQLLDTFNASVGRRRSCNFW